MQSKGPGVILASFLVILAQARIRFHLDFTSLLTSLSLDVYIPREQIHFVRLLSGSTHLGQKKSGGSGLQMFLLVRTFTTGKTRYGRRKLLCLLVPASFLREASLSSSSSLSFWSHTVAIESRGSACSHPCHPGLACPECNRRVPGPHEHTPSSWRPEPALSLSNGRT